MELTPKLFDDVEFREKFRGYDPDEVDAFLEQVARGVDLLQQRLKEATERAERAEARAREVGDTDDALRRTLVLAQRTADAAVAEAEARAGALTADAAAAAERVRADALAYAARTTADADDRASRTVTDAEERAASRVREAMEQARDVVRDAEREARSGADDIRRRLRDEIVALEAARERLRTDCARLEAHLDVQRGRVRATIGALERLVHDPDALSEAPVPDFRPVPLPEPADTVLHPTSALLSAALSAVSAQAGEHAEQAGEHAGEHADLPVPAESVQAEAVAAESVPGDGPSGDVAPGDGSLGDDGAGSLEPTQAHDALAAEASARGAGGGDGDGPGDAGDTVDVATQPLGAPEPSVEEVPTGELSVVAAEPAPAAAPAGPPAAATPGSADDPYLAELRRAIDDQAPLGPRDDAMDDAFARFYEDDEDLEQPRRSLFRRRA